MNERLGPLRDLRIVELGGIGPTPFCAMILADLGADVVRIERDGAEVPAMTTSILRGRPTVSIDLKDPSGIEAIMRLVAKADVLIEGFRPGVTERLGIGPSACFARNPGLVYGRMTGWGQIGPLSQAPGHDLNYIALTGALAAIGGLEGRPTIPLNLIGDFGGGGMLLAIGVLSAVIEARENGAGQVVDAAMIDGAALLMTMFYGLYADGAWSLTRGTNLLDGGAPFYDVYTTADDRLISIACLETKFYEELLAVLEIDDPVFQDMDDRTHWPALRDVLRSAIGGLTLDECERLFGETQVCFAPVLNIEEAPHHAHNRARETFYRQGDNTLPSPAPRFSRTMPGTPLPGRSIGIESALAAWSA